MTENAGIVLKAMCGLSQEYCTSVFSAGAIAWYLANNRRNVELGKLSEGKVKDALHELRELGLVRNSSEKRAANQPPVNGWSVTHAGMECDEYRFYKRRHANDLEYERFRDEEGNALRLCGACKHYSVNEDTGERYCTNPSSEYCQRS